MQYLLCDKPMKENNISNLWIKLSFYSISNVQIQFLIFLIKYLKPRKKRTFVGDREIRKIKFRDVPETVIISRTSPCPILKLCAIREVLYVAGRFLLPTGGALPTV